MFILSPFRSTLVLALALTPNAVHAAAFTTVVFPTDVFTQLLGVNNQGVISGYHGDGLTPATPNKGLVFLPPNYNNTASQLSENFPASVQTQVVAINNTASTAAGGFETAGFYVDGGGNNHGFFIDQNGVFHNIDAPGTTFNQILGINDNGVLAGYSQDAMGVQHAYTESGGVFTAINTPGGTSAQATTINKAGNVGGFYADSVNPANFHGYLDIGGVIKTVDAPGSVSTQILGLNIFGQFVGDYVDAGGNMHGFFDSGSTFVTLDGFNGTTATTFNGINDKGQIVGFYMDPTHNNATIGLTGTIPEPTTFGMAAIGAALLLLRFQFRPQR